MSGSTLANTNSGSTVPDPGLKSGTEADANSARANRSLDRQRCAANLPAYLGYPSERMAICPSTNW
jgi:hypothetical protein